MKRISVSVDDEVYRLARAKAIERKTSLSALVRRILIGLATTEGDPEKLKRQEAALRASIREFRAADRLTRNDVHRRT